MQSADVFVTNIRTFLLKMPVFIEQCSFIMLFYVQHKIEVGLVNSCLLQDLLIIESQKEFPLQRNH